MRPDRTSLQLLTSTTENEHEIRTGNCRGFLDGFAGLCLLTSGNTVTVNVFEASSPKPVSTKGYIAAVLVAGGAGRETVTLAPQGENSLKGDAKNPIAASATITLTIKTAEGKSGQVKFKR